MLDKLQALKNSLAEMKSVLVAYSGGVDSTFLLKVAKDILKDKAVAVTALSRVSSVDELRQAEKLAGLMGVTLLRVETDEFANEKFTRNHQDRCYWCKKELFGRFIDLATENNIDYVVDGSNYSDRDDFRPGMKALAELGVKSPLGSAGLTKDEIRVLSRQLGLSTWNKPSLACLASRFPYGTRITEENMARVESAEKFLQELGIGQLRVRHYNDTARIEIEGEEFSKLMEEDVRQKVVSYFKGLGYIYISLDLEGFRSGSMNEVF